MRQTLTRMGVAAVVLAGGLAMIQAGIERMQHLSADAERQGTEVDIPGSVFILLVVGVFVMTPAAFSGLSTWSRHLRHNPKTRQVPTWILLVIFVAAGGLGLAGLAAHSGSLTSADAVSTTVDWDFVAVETILGTIAIEALILLGARWTPQHRPARAR